MKDSGIEWIGEIPEGWEIIPVKYLAKYNYDTLAESCSPDFEFSYIDIGSVTYTDGITNYQNFKFKDAPSRARRIVHSGDILVSTVRTYLRAVACVNEHRLPQIASTGFLVLQADISKIHPHFLMYSVLSDNFICKVEANSVGISYPAINASQIVHFKLPIPQLSEQFLLVTYLDRQCSEIDALLSKTLSSIEEYKKLKQAVITQAVTKGVRGEREMKDSGVEWIGEIPKEWVCEKIKYATSISRGLFNHRPRNDERYYNGKYPFIQTGDVANATKYIVSYSQTLNELGKSVSKEFPKGTLTMTIAANVGDVAILNFDAYFPDSVVGFVPNKNIRTLYLFYVFSAMKDEFIRTAIKSTQLNLNIDRVKETFIPVTLNVNEQCEIENYLESKCAEIDRLIAKKEQLVKELESYKKSLIYEVVTGKREV